MKALGFLTLLLFFSCVGPEKEVTCQSGEAFDKGRGKCVKSLGANVLTININGFFPLEDYTASTADNDITHSITVDDTYQNGFIPEWRLLKPGGGQDILGNGLSQVLKQSQYPPGPYQLEVRLLETTATTVLDSKVWNITLTDQVIPNITQVTGNPITTTEVAGPSIINANLFNTGSLSNVEYSWAVNGVNIPGEIGPLISSPFAASFTFNPTLMANSYYDGLGPYEVSLTLRDAITKSLFARSTWDIEVELAPFATLSMGVSPTHSTTTPAQSETLTLIEDTDVLTGALMFDIDSSGILNTGTEEIDICILASSNTGITGDQLQVDFFSNGVFIGNTSFSTTTACLITAAPGFKKVLPANITSEIQKISAIVFDSYTGVSNLPSYKGKTEIGRFEWDLKLRKKNTPPIISINDTNASNNPNNGTTNLVECDQKSSTSFLKCTVTQGADVAFDLSLNVQDEDYDPSDTVDITIGSRKFRIDFFLNGKPLDGTHDLSPSNCQIPFGSAVDLSTYTCSIIFNPFTSKGPINPKDTSYVISARVSDDDSPFTTDDGISNTLTWQFSTIRDHNRQIVIDPGTFTTSGLTTERSIINFDVDITDPDSDSFTVEVFRLPDTTTPILTQVIESTDNQTTKSLSLPHTITQDTVVGAASATIDYRIVATDILDGQQAGVSSTTASLDLSVSSAAVAITNFNEHPVFNSANFNPSIPSSLVAFTGLPLTIDPGTITDSTLIDGEEIKYQWQISTDAGTSYTAIPGATQRVLIWSPGSELDFSSQTGTAIKLRLCVGDNGLIDGGIVSKNPEGQNTCPGGLAVLDTSGGLPAAAWDVTVFSNMTGTNGLINSYRDSDVPESEMALWTDPRTKDPIVTYMAFVSTQATGSRNIIVEKIITHKNGTKSGSQTPALNSLSLPFQVNPEANIVLKDLSLVGDTNRNQLYLAYDTLTTAAHATPGVRITHIKRIAITPGKANLTHNGSFSYDTNYSLGGAIANGAITSSDSNIISFSKTDTTLDTVTTLHFTNNSNNIATMTFISSEGNTTFVAGVDYCLTPCLTVESTALAFRNLINAQTSTAFKNIISHYDQATQELLIFGLDQGRSLSVASLSQQNPVLTQPSNSAQNPLVLRPTKVKFTTGSSGVGGPITFRSPAGNINFTSGVDFCVTACSSIDETSVAFKDMLNTQTDQRFDDIVATYDTGMQTLLIYGLEKEEYFTVTANTPQSPELINPMFNQVVFKQAMGTETITINGLAITGNTDICTGSTCPSEIESAFQLTNFINNSTDLELQGITAEHKNGSGKVLLYGINDGEYYNANNNSVKLGKISLSETLDKWYLPFIDGNNGHKVGLLRGSLKTELAFSSPEIISLNTSVTDQVELAHDHDNFENTILVIKEIVGADTHINVYELDQFHNIRNQELNIFNGLSVNDLLVAAHKDTLSNDPSVLLVTKTAGALASALFQSQDQEYDLFNALKKTDLGAGFDPITNIRAYELISNLEQNSFFLATNSLTSTLPDVFDLHLLEINLDPNTQDLNVGCSFDSSDLLNLSKCMQIRGTSAQSLFNFRPAMGRALSSVQVGTDGASNDESIQPLLPIAFHIDDGGNNPDEDALPILALINIGPLKLTVNENANTGASSMIPYRPQH